MNIQAQPGNKVETPEGPGKWERRQQPVCPTTIAHATRVRPLGATSPIGIGWIPHCGRTVAQSFAVRSESAEVNYRPELRSEGNDETSSNSQGNPEALDALLSRYRGVLSFVAYRVLGDHIQAEDAVQRCLLSASC